MYSCTPHGLASKRCKPCALAEKRWHVCVWLVEYRPIDRERKEGGRGGRESMRDPSMGGRGGGENRLNLFFESIDHLLIVIYI